MSEREASRDDQAERSGRSVAEWTTLGISLAILAVVFGAIAWLWIRNDAAPATIAVTPVSAEIRQEADVWYLPLEVTNTGDATAEEVIVEAELDLGDGEPETSEVTFAFLASGETVRGTVMFTDDPASGSLTVRPVSLKEP